MCASSKEEELALLARAGRLAASLSHKIQKKNKEVITEIMDPRLATKLKAL